ncbi:MAG: HEAT repeat domain-containing protein, partial [Armatimonadetes bacterium]|nr:HEAT repeat domain-containing protein [Armatimonadota bacterium]
GLSAGARIRPQLRRGAAAAREAATPEELCRQLDREETAGAALRRLRSIGPEAIPAARAHLTSPSPAGRSRAAWLLGSLGAREAVPELIPLLADPHAGVRRAAAIALTELPDPQALAPLLQAIPAAEEAAFRNALALAVVRINEPRVAYTLANRLRRAPDCRPRPAAVSEEPVWRWIVVHLAAAGDRAATLLLYDLLFDPSETICGLALEGLVRIARERPDTVLAWVEARLDVLISVRFREDVPMQLLCTRAQEEIRGGLRRLRAIPQPAQAPQPVPTGLPVPAAEPHCCPEPVSAPFPGGRDRYRQLRRWFGLDCDSFR